MILGQSVRDDSVLCFKKNYLRWGALNTCANFRCENTLNKILFTCRVLLFSWLHCVFFVVVVVAEATKKVMQGKEI